MGHDGHRDDVLDGYRHYIEALYTSSTSLQRRQFIERTGWRDFVPVVDDDAARFLRVILHMQRPKKILEIGTSIGFSATSMALVARRYGGSIFTVEFDSGVAGQAQKNFETAGVDDVVHLIHGDALEIVPGFPDESFDMVFQDVDKRLYPTLLDDCIRVLKPGGVLIGDDALFPVMNLDEKWSDQVSPMDEFNQKVVAPPELESTLLPIGDGMMLAIKRG